MKENIYVDLDEDIQSVLQKIQMAAANNLDLVIPTGARVLQNIVDAHLLKEAGDENGKNLVVVTSDLMGKIFAERAGLTVAGQSGFGARIAATSAISTGRISDIIPRKKIIVAPAQAVSKKTALGPKPITKTSAKSAAKKLSSAVSESFKKKGEIGASFLKSYREERAQTNVFNDLKKINRRSKRKLPFNLNTFTVVWVVVAVALLVGVFVIAKTVPRADITVYPVREPKNQNIDIVVSSTDTQVDLTKGIIPGELLTSDKAETGDYPATGQKNVSEKAKGKITVYNSYSSQPQAFVASRFQSEDGKIFWSTKSITVPGAVIKNGKSTPGQITVDVIAGEAGEAYNIGPSKFSMPGLKGTPRADKIYAISDAAMAGGKTGQSKVVSSDDATKAYADLKSKIEPELESFKNNLPVGFQMWSEAYNEELADSSVAPDVGESADTFKATVKLIGRAVVFKSQDLETYINQEITKNIDDGKVLLMDSKEISFLKAPVVDYQKGTIQATLQVKYDIIDKIDSDAFKSEILDKKQSDIKTILTSHKNVERVEGNLWPFWVRSVPSNPDRVNIKVVGL